MNTVTANDIKYLDNRFIKATMKTSNNLMQEFEKKWKKICKQNKVNKKDTETKQLITSEWLKTIVYHKDTMLGEIIL